MYGDIKNQNGMRKERKWE